MITEAHHGLDDGRVRRDAKKKLKRLYAARARLLPEADDGGFILSELSSIASEIAACELELANGDQRQTVET